MKPLVYLFPGLMCDATVWAAQASGLEDIVEVVVPEFRGFDTLAGMAESAIRGAPRRFSVAGHSMGGRAALEAFRIAGPRIERLALLDTGVAPRADGESLKRRRLIELAHREGMASVAKAWIPGMVHPDRLEDFDLMQEMTAMICRCKVADFESQQNALLNRPDASDLLSGIACPTLVACGREDAWAPPDQHQDMADGIAAARLEVFEHCGHMSPMERPGEVTAALRAWLTS